MALNLCIRYIFVIVIVVCCNDVTANYNCIEHALTLAGISKSSAVGYTKLFGEHSASLSDLRNANDFTLRALGVKLQDDRIRISSCFANNEPSAASNAACSISAVCSGRGVCEMRTNASTGSNYYACNCGKAYMGEKCEEIENNCINNPCHHGGRCQNAPNNFTCHCKVGYAGRLCTEKWLTRPKALSRVQQLSSDVRGAIDISNSRLTTLLRQQSGAISSIASAIAELKRQRLPKYRVYTDLLTWSEAHIRCSQYGGGLAMIKSRQEQDKLYDIARHYRVSRIWLGGGDYNIEGHFYWWDRTTMVFSNFLPGEPNQNKGGNEDCIEMIMQYDGLYGRWNVMPCSTRSPYACQFYN